MESRRTKPFFPDDKPRTWVIGVSAGIISVIVGTAAFLAKMSALDVLATMLRLVSISCGAVMLSMMVVFNLKLLLGQYKTIHPSKWKDKPW